MILNKALKLLVAASVTGTACASCESDLASLVSEGLDAPTVSKQATPDMCTIVDAPGVTVCNYYAHQDVSDYTSRCNAKGGDVIPIVTEKNCPLFNLIEKVIVPWCVPQTCDVDEQIALREANDPTAGLCDTITVNVDNCSADRAIFMREGLPFKFPFPTGCTFDGSSSPPMTSCDFYNVAGLTEMMSTCLSAGGNLIAATEDQTCEFLAGSPTRTIILAPLCIPNSCDANAFLAERAAASFCNATVTSPDVTAAPTISVSIDPTTAPTISPTAQASASPTTSSPTLLPTTSSPTLSPTTESPTTPPTFVPTNAPVLCKDRAFLDENLCVSQSLAFGELDYDLFREREENIFGYCTGMNDQGVEVCDIYDSMDIDNILEACETKGGDSIPFTIRESCPSGINQKVTGPVCIPKSCDTETFIEALITNETAAFPKNCTIDVSHVPIIETIVDYCVEDCVDQSTHNEKMCISEQGRFAIAGFFYFKPLGVGCKFINGGLVCDHFQSDDIYDIIETCTVEGGDTLNVTATEVCEFVERTTSTTFISPMCMSRFCDPFQAISDVQAQLKSNAEVECTITLTADIFEEIPYCGYEAPVQPAVTLPDACEADLTRLRDASGLMVGMFDAGNKVCQTRPTDGGLIRTKCTYTSGEREEIVEACSTMGAGFSVSNMTTTRDCTIYTQDSTEIVPNTMCIPASCEMDDLVEVLVYEQSLIEVLGCEVSSMIMAPPVVTVVGDEVDSNDVTPGTDPDRAGTESGAFLSSLSTNFALSAMAFFLFSY